MSNQGIVCTLQSDADSYAAQIDVKLGYPKDGIDIGDGIHASKLESRTQRHNRVYKHPTLAEWAYPRDAIETAQAVALPIGSTVQTLDTTWFPVVAITGQVG
jgi:hypothetical protein